MTSTKVDFGSERVNRGYSPNEKTDRNIKLTLLEELISVCKHFETHVLCNKVQK